MREQSYVSKSFADTILNTLRSRKAQHYIKPDTVVCDLGCGYKAHFLQRVESIIKHGIGFDVAVDTTLNSKKINLQPLDLNTSIPLADNTVDTVVSLAVIEHLNDYKKFTEEIYRILKKDGQAVITTPKALIEPIIQTMWRIGLLEKEEVQDHKRYFTKTQLEELFHGAGFRQVSVTSFELGLNQLVIVTK